MFVSVSTQTSFICITVYLWTDLLPNGKTTGQTARLLVDPERREQEMKKAAEEKENQDKEKAVPKEAVKEKEKDKEKANKKAGRDNKSPGSKAPKDGLEGESVLEEPVVPEKPPLTRNWLNMVCYGLPNLVVTQVGK